MKKYYLSTEYREIVVGWDPTLQTFFLEILYPLGDDDSEIVLSRGTQPGDLPTIESLARALAPYDSLTRDLWQQLAAEKAKSTNPIPASNQDNQVMESSGSPENHNRY